MTTPLEKFLELAPKPRPLKDGEAYTVFLSYRSVNRSWVINLYDVLVQAGHTVFLDQRVLVAGGQLQRSIEDALAASQAGVLIWSEASADSEWVRDEYETMRGRMRREDEFYFVPVRLDRGPLPTFARNQIYLDFSGYPDGPNGGELLRLLHGVVGQPLSDEAMRFSEDLEHAAREAMIDIKANEDIGDADHLAVLFDQGGLAWEITPALGSRAIEAMIRLKHLDAAVDRARTQTDRFPKAIRPKQMLAHALTRRAEKQARPEDLVEAQRILARLYAAGEKDPETLGLYGRTFMDQYGVTGDKAQLRRSRDLYEEGFRTSRDDTYCGINAAAKSIFLAEDPEIAHGRQIAEEVAALLPAEVSPQMDYWDGATIAEAALIAGRIDDAAGLYTDAVALAPNAIGSHESSHRQATRLLEAMGASPDDCAKINAAFAHLDADG